MINNLFTRLGLSDGEAAIYQNLLDNGEGTAAALAERTGIKRTLIYHLIKGLETQGLAESFEKNKITHFRPSPPAKLEELFFQKKRELEAVSGSLSETLPALTSQYRLVTRRPAVGYYEGKEGIKKVLEDSLTARSEIYSYADLEAIEKYIADVNRSYVQKREKLGIKKKGIVLDTPFAREFLKDYHPTVTETKLIASDAVPFRTIMQIYDGKISYITPAEDRMIGVIIEDAHIYAMHKLLFEYLWAITP